ncbi:acyl-[acyl-carrier-protein] thioesterase [Dellaglioa algida]|uniref:acyl-[acyl-carrier-protein] thioesterase n=1 Tax=Dellaglioa algida TaxID=105612 RepID=UPI0024DE89F4|nr:acyl-ACP thioesterase domain-containing protein [Dellaglioa algida]MDK1740931.1 thioesterase [Dellaglioa algida]
MEDNKFSETHRAVYYEGDKSGRVTMAMLINMIILVSTDQSDHLGLTEKHLSDLGFGWVITQYLIDVERIPHIDEKLTLTTEAVSYNRFFCYRDFWVHDEEGNECARVHAVLVLMDHETRKMVRVLPEVIEPFGAEYTRRIERLENPVGISDEDTVDFKKSYDVRFFDIDPNQHVNNSRYFDWLLDSLTEEFLMSHNLKHMNIKYEKEIHYGHKIDSIVVIKNEGLLTHHQIKIGDDVYCEADCEWTER